MPYKIGPSPNFTEVVKQKVNFLTYILNTQLPLHREGEKKPNWIVSNNTREDIALCKSP